MLIWETFRIHPGSKLTRANFITAYRLRVRVRDIIDIEKIIKSKLKNAKKMQKK